MLGPSFGSGLFFCLGSAWTADKPEAAHRRSRAQRRRPEAAHRPETQRCTDLTVLRDREARRTPSEGFNLGFCAAQSNKRGNHARFSRAKPSILCKAARTTRKRRSRRGKLALTENAERRLAKNACPFTEVSVIKERKTNEQTASSNIVPPPKYALPVMGNLPCGCGACCFHARGRSNRRNISKLAESMVGHRPGSPAPLNLDRLNSRRDTQPVLER